jgi:AhpD family alkylhydroperoxidase
MKRIQIKRIQPAAYDAMNALEHYVANSSIDKIHQELLKIRASQINGCAYCVDMHTHDALKAGESLQRILLVSAWKEAGAIFTEEERLLFQMTEEITLIHQEGLTDDTYAKAIELLGEEKTAQVVMAIITINAWNRIGVATELRPPQRNKLLISNY